MSRSLQHNRVVLLAIAFVMGFNVMSLEMIGSRYLNPFFGGSIFTWGAIIATVLAALSVGYFFGGRLADRHPSSAVLALLTVPAAVYLAVLPMIGPGVAVMIADNVVDPQLGVLLASTLLLCPPLLFMGAFSPFIVRLVLTSEKESGKISGMIYGVSNVGSIFGTLITTFYLIPAMGTRMITVALSLSTFLCIVVLMLVAPPNVKEERKGLMTFLFPLSRPALIARMAVGLVAFVALLVWSFIVTAGPAHASPPQQTQQAKPAASRPAEKQIDYVESPYNTVIVMQQGPYMAMQFGYRNRRWVESMSNPTDPTELPVEYTQVMNAGLAYTKDLKNVLMIGLGGGSTTVYLAHYMPDVTQVAVEIDPAVIQMAKKHFGVKEGPNLKVFEADGRMFLRRRPDKYDVVMIDAYRGWFVPFHLLTVEFYKQVKAKLQPGGVVVQNIEPSTMLFDSAISTIKAVFDNVELYDAGGNIVVVAYSGKKKTPAELLSRSKELQDKYKFRYSMESLLKGSKPLVYDKKVKALTDDFAPVEIMNNTQKPD